VGEAYLGLEALLNIREGRRHAREKSRLGGTRADLWRHTVRVAD